MGLVTQVQAGSLISVGEMLIGMYPGSAPRSLRLVLEGPREIPICRTLELMPEHLQQRARHVFSRLQEEIARTRDLEPLRFAVDLRAMLEKASGVPGLSLDGGAVRAVRGNLLGFINYVSAKRSHG